MGTQARQDIESVGWQYPVKQFEQALYHAANIKAAPLGKLKSTVFPNGGDMSWLILLIPWA
jgi:hypothetical protein